MSNLEDEEFVWVPEHNYYFVKYGPSKDSEKIRKNITIIPITSSIKEKEGGLENKTNYKNIQ